MAPGVGFWVSSSSNSLSADTERKRQERQRARQDKLLSAAKRLRWQADRCAEQYADLVTSSVDKIRKLDADIASLEDQLRVLKASRSKLVEAASKLRTRE